MIVQDASPGRPRFVMRMSEHTAVAGQLAEAFGNEEFDPLHPRGILEDVIRNHDVGWAEIDARVLQDPDTGLPYHLADTPLDEMVHTISMSPDANEAVHPYAGVISSMHSYGLYTGRYGLSDRLAIDVLPDELRPLVTDLLARELARQERLIRELATDDTTADWVTEAALFRNYKLLQFFDGFALYLQCRPPGERGSTRFAHVPKRADDVTVSASETDPATVAVTPWPFAGESVTVATNGRMMTPARPGTDLAPLFARAPVTHQQVTLVAEPEPA